LCLCGSFLLKAPECSPTNSERWLSGLGTADITENLACLAGADYNIDSMPSINPSAKRRLTTLDGTPASCLGLAAGPKQDPRCVRRAFVGGVNYFFFYGPGHTSFIKELAALVSRKREQIIVATGSGSRRIAGLRAARRKLTILLGIELIDVFFIEYVHPGDNPNVMFGKNGVLDELRQWKENGWVRFVGATAHDRSLARRLAADPRVDVLMHRYNMAHRKSAQEVFPAAAKARTPVVAFTATRWGTLLEPNADWLGPPLGESGGCQLDRPTEKTLRSPRPPTASDCYRFCLAHPAVHVVLTAPHSLGELEQNLDVLDLPPMSKQERVKWHRFGDLVYGAGKGAFETSWP
jgi:aryl-alcohol dehydrogenase-like predicted oxidoreductase